MRSVELVFVSACVLLVVATVDRVRASYELAPRVEAFGRIVGRDT